MRVLLVGSPARVPGGLAAGPACALVAVVAPEPGSAAVTAVRAHRPAAVLVDLDAVGGHEAADRTGAAGLEAIRALTLAAAGPDGPDQVAAAVPVIAVAADAGLLLAAVRAGATGFVLREDPRLPLVVADAVAGGSAFGAGLAERVLEAAAGPGTTPPRLTEREAEILQLVVAGLTARQVAHRLTLSPRTVENHVQRILRKFGAPGRAALVRYAIENGLA